MLDEANKLCTHCLKTEHLQKGKFETNGIGFGYNLRYILNLC